MYQNMDKWYRAEMLRYCREGTVDFDQICDDPCVVMVFDMNIPDSAVSSVSYSSARFFGMSFRREPSNVITDPISSNEESDSDPESEWRLFVVPNDDHFRPSHNKT